ncbi:hypothetical protein [Salinirarus marinus]|uniref:hypothetical protein n=1 Tax=Salinirarus marinus TaxID=3068310 RepID=UPI003C6C1E43
MTRNPHGHAQSVGRFNREMAFAERGTVVSVKAHQQGDDVRHHVQVRADSTGQDSAAIVTTQMVGDAHIPSVGDRVLMIRRRDGVPVVIGVLYSESDSPPEYDPGERVIGVPDSDAEVRLKPNGNAIVQAHGHSLEIESDGIHVDGGDRGAVVDVSAASTNSNGGITALDISRSNSLFVP